MNRKNSHRDKQKAGLVRDFLDVLSERNLYPDIIGYGKRSESDQDFVINCNEENISLQVTEIVDIDFTFPISRSEYRSGRYSHFIAQASGEIPLAVDNNRLNTSIQRKIQGKVEKHVTKADDDLCWLLIFSTSAYPEIDCCVRGNKSDSQAISIARDYLYNSDQVIFDQIWYTNLVTAPVRIWPYRTGQIC